MCDVARRGCDVAGDLRQHRVRCRSRAGRHRSWWRGEWPSDVAMSCDVRGGRERRGGVASDIAGAASDVAQVARARERLSDIARASSDIARDIPRGGWRGGDIRKLMFSLCPAPPPCGRPRLGGATWRHRSGGQRSRSAAPTSGTMLRHRSGPERHRSAMLACDVTMSCDVARPSQRRSPQPEAAERHRSGLERHRNIAPARGGRAKERHRTPAERHRHIAKTRMGDYLRSSGSRSSSSRRSSVVVVVA